MGREENENEGGEIEERESYRRSHDAFAFAFAFFTPRHSLLSERLEQATLGLSLYPISLFLFGEIRSSCYESFFPSFLFHHL